MNICIVGKDLEEIKIIKPLWEQHQSIRIEKLHKMKSNKKVFSFKNGIDKICKKAENGKIKLEMLLDNDSGDYVGYCISSINDNLGEIESIYVKNRYRKTGYGAKLLENAMSWFESNKVTDIS